MGVSWYWLRAMEPVLLVSGIETMGSAGVVHLRLYGYRTHWWDILKIYNLPLDAYSGDSCWYIAIRERLSACEMAGEPTTSRFGLRLGC